jgi:pilus assembly protein CpaC
MRPISKSPSASGGLKTGLLCARLMTASALVPLTGICGSSAWAQPPSPLQSAPPASLDVAKPKPVHGSITLSAGNGQVIHLNAPATNVFTADPKVAEVRPASSNSLFVFGVAPGSTTVAVLDTSGALIAQYQVAVVPSNFDASMAKTAIGRGGRNAVSAHATETGVSLGGHVATANDAEKAVLAAKGALPADGKVDNQMTTDEPIQVSLHVRVAEMSRTLTRELGVNWSAATQLGREAAFGVSTSNLLSTVAGVSPSEGQVQLGSSKAGYSLDAVVDALSEDQLVHVLAEPNLTTMSGQPASFLVGGEFPIPVATTQANGNNNGTFSIDFKQYGISLSFIPTVMSHNRISLHVRPEVSQLDKANGVTSYVSGNVTLSIPALTVRRADTTVELGSGQSFAIAGLLSDQTTQGTQATPGLGDIPILGALFRSDSFTRAETELVIVVTPYIVRPISDPSALHLPTDGFKVPNDLERILQLRQFGSGSFNSNGPYRRIPADAGFFVE